MATSRKPGKKSGKKGGKRSRKAPHQVKGSAAAKKHMAKLRAAKKAKAKGGKSSRAKAGKKRPSNKQYAARRLLKQHSYCLVCHRSIGGGQKGMDTHYQNKHSGAPAPVVGTPAAPVVAGAAPPLSRFGAKVQKRTFAAGKVLARYEQMKKAREERARLEALRADAKTRAEAERKVREAERAAKAAELEAERERFLGGAAD